MYEAVHLYESNAFMSLMLEITINSMVSVPLSYNYSKNQKEKARNKV